jgi:streptogramin lyase
MLKLLICVLATSIPSADVSTVAGNGTRGYSGDGSPANRLSIGEPYGLVHGPDGALYVCDIANHVIRRVDERKQHVSVFAGTPGKSGYAGDGGPATKALLNQPYEVRFDRRGNMYFVEMINNLVRKVDAKSGIISTVAGSGERGFSGDEGPAIKAKLNRPHSIALDESGNLYICDIGNHRIRRVDLKSGLITTFAGTGQKKPTPDGAKLKGTPLNGPRALDFDGRSNLFLALREGNAVYRINLKTQTLHHVAGTGKKGRTGDGGPAKQARLSGPKGIAIGPRGDVYLADTESHTIRVIRMKSKTIETIIGHGTRGKPEDPDAKPLDCRLARPHGIYVDPHGNIYIGDSETYRVRRLSAPAPTRR